MEAGLTVADIQKRFGATHVLRGVCLEAPPGRVTGLLGPNGAGKSTLFAVLMGLLRPDAGRAHLGGVDLLSLPLHRKASAGLGYLPQESASFPELTARRNLLAVVELRVRSRVERRARVEALLDQIGLRELAERRYGALSTGERRRLEIAKALAFEPRVLLLDEPFAGLDPRITEDLLHVIRGLSERGVGVLFTDHNVHTALRVADFAYVLADGRVAFEGDPADLVANEAVRDAYLGSSFGGAP